MTLPNSGSLSFTQIISEFGNRGSIGNYRVNQDIGERNWTLDENFPTSGSVSFSTFRGKRRNIVVDCYSEGGSRVSASGREGRVTVGGGPTSTSGSRVIIYVNNTFTSDSTQTRNRCALTTGTYGNAENGTPSKVDIIMGNSARIYGGGGNGGNGGNAGGRNANAGNNGNPGTSALGLQTSVEEIVLSSSSLIRAGSGGGGGGGGGAAEISNSEEYGGGGGGGGGAGHPAGSGGLRGNSAGEVTFYGDNGGSGNASNGNGGGGGEGAIGGQNEQKASGGGGGGGGSWGGTAGNGGEGGQGDEGGSAEDGSGGDTEGEGGGGGKGGARGSGQDEGSGGGGGSSGYSICSNGGILINVSGGTVQGPTGAGQGVS